MNKEFVPYELAVKLKELGFNERCLFAFDNCSTPMRCTDLRTSDQKFNGVNYNSSSYTSQPTFSQAFEWFRKKYHIIGYPIFKGGKTTQTAWYDYVIYSEIEWEVDNPNQQWKTYEEAELACLEKLIELIENK